MNVFSCILQKHKEELKEESGLCENYSSQDKELELHEIEFMQVPKEVTWKSQFLPVSCFIVQSFTLTVSSWPALPYVYFWRDDKRSISLKTMSFYSGSDELTKSSVYFSLNWDMWPAMQQGSVGKWVLFQGALHSSGICGYWWTTSEVCHIMYSFMWFSQQLYVIVIINGIWMRYMRDRYIKYLHIKFTSLVDRGAGNGMFICISYETWG